MAYEHYSGTAVPQSDLYSLGACLYEMLTGRCPPAFGLETPIPPSQFNRAISPALDHAVLKCLRPDPRRRYGSAGGGIDGGTATSGVGQDLEGRVTFPLSAFARCTFCTSVLYYQGLWTGPACFRI